MGARPELHDLCPRHGRQRRTGDAARATGAAIALKTSGAPSLYWMSADWTTTITIRPRVSAMIVSLAPIDLLARIIARNPAAFRGLDALAVDHTRRRPCLAAFELPRAHDQQVVDALPQAAVAPSVEVALDRGERRKVLRQHAPLATARRNVEDRIRNRTEIGRSRPATSFGCRQQRRDPRPFATRQIAWIAHGLPSMLVASGISPRHLVPSIFSPTKAREESQSP